MKTDPFADDLKAYLDGELSWPRRLAVRRHLTHCASCQEEISHMTQTAEDLRKTEQANPLNSALRARILGTAFADVQGPVFNAQRVRQAQDRILKVCFSASVAINLLFVGLVSHSDIFGSAANLATLREKPIKIYKPVLVKPHPKPPKSIPPPPPPKQRPQPKIKPPLHVQRPTPHPPVPTHRYQVATTKSPHAVSSITMPSGPVAPLPQKPSMPTYTKPPAVARPSLKETPPESVFVAPPPPDPAQAPPAKPQPVMEAPPPPEVHKPVIIDRDEPEIMGNINDIHLPQVDISTLSVSEITASWDVDEQGHTKNIRLSPKTSGNFDVDSAILEAIHNFQYKPRIHNGQPQPAHITHSFTLGN